MDADPSTPGHPTQAARRRVLAALGAFLLALGLRAHVVTPPGDPALRPPSCPRWVQVGKEEAPLLCLPPLGQEPRQAAGIPEACLKSLAHAPLVSGDRLVVTKTGCELLRMSPAQVLTLSIAVPVNRASEAELATLPGIGPALAKRILLHREAQGPFTRSEDLTRVKGIGPRLARSLRPRLVF